MTFTHSIFDTFKQNVNIPTAVGIFVGSLSVFVAGPKHMATNLARPGFFYTVCFSLGTLYFCDETSQLFNFACLLTFPIVDRLIRTTPETATMQQSRVVEDDDDDDDSLKEEFNTKGWTFINPNEKRKVENEQIDKESKEQEERENKIFDTFDSNTSLEWGFIQVDGVNKNVFYFPSKPLQGEKLEEIPAMSKKMLDSQNKTAYPKYEIFDGSMQTRTLHDNKMVPKEMEDLKEEREKPLFEKEIIIDPFCLSTKIEDDDDTKESCGKTKETFDGDYDWLFFPRYNHQ